MLIRINAAYWYIDKLIKMEGYLKIQIEKSITMLEILRKMYIIY